MFFKTRDLLSAIPSRLIKRHLLTIGMLSSTLHGDTLTYQNTIGSETTSIVFTLSQLAHAKKAKVEWHENGNISFSEVMMTDSFSTLSWRYKYALENSDINGQIAKDTVFLRGTHKKKKINKKFSAKGLDWKQVFPYDLKLFVVSDSSSIHFNGISLIGFANMQFGTLEAKKIGTEHLTLWGKDLELLHVRVSLPGLASIFWHGDYWYLKNSGMLIKSVAVNSPGAPPTISVLTKPPAQLASFSETP
jgi:hypothetical protein